MIKVVASVARKKRHKKFLDLAKGYYGRAKNCYRIARNKVEKGLEYAFRDRKTKKRVVRSLWITRINAALRELGTKYSEFICKLNNSSVEINRKHLAYLAYTNQPAFEAIVKKVTGQ